jgi:hypothetical protein
MDYLKRGYFQRIPWWIHIAMATVLYIGFTYLAPTLHTESRWIGTLVAVAPNLAPIGTIAFLLMGAKALYDDSPAHKGKPPDREEENTRPKGRPSSD